MNLAHISIELISIVNNTIAIVGFYFLIIMLFDNDRGGYS
jgi:hypothetical protein